MSSDYDATEFVDGDFQAAHKGSFPAGLTRGLTGVENARMEWNGARLKFPVLSGAAAQEAATAPAATKTAPASPFATQSFLGLCKMGLALTWPLVVVALAALGIFL